jgi:hypothetical protein
MLVNHDALTIVVFDNRKSITPRFQFSYHQQSEEGGLARA